MSAPQLENGFIRIASGDDENDVFSALARCRLSGIEFQIVLLVIRQTWGYNKKEDWISLSQFQQVTGASRSYVCRAIEHLVTCRILVTRKSPGQTFYAFNKDFRRWVVTLKSLVTKKSLLVTPTSRASDVQVTQLVTPTSHTKDNYTKDNIQKTPSSTRKGPNLGVQSIMDAMRECFGELDDSEAKNRQYAWNLLKKAGGKSEPCVALIRAAARHDFWGHKITRVEHVYKNAKRITLDLQESGRSAPKIVSI